MGIEMSHISDHYRAFMQEQLRAGVSAEEIADRLNAVPVPAPEPRPEPPPVPKWTAQSVTDYAAHELD